jgi:nitronate monooxygenase
MFPEVANPIVLAPMAGGPTTPALVAAVLEAGAFGFLAAGYKSAEDVAADIAALRSATSRRFGVNLFVPGPDDADAAAIAAYAVRIGADAADARWSDDDWDAKLAVVLRERPAVVSFTFGCPPRATIGDLHAAGIEVWCTVTSRAEAQEADAAGADVLVVQGAEAGGHQGTYDDRDDEPVPLLPLLRDVRAASALPLVGSGGVATREQVAAVLDAGAAAAQVGTAFMLAPEAATADAQRRSFAGDAPTALTRAFTGRLARGIVNRFMTDHPDAPRAYPEINHATSALRAEARKREDADGFNLWAGQGHALARERPAGETVRRLSRPD